MIDTQVLVEEFCELVKTDSPSGQEGAVADLIVAKLQALGLSVVRDEAHCPIDGQCGNIIAKLPASDPEMPTIMLNAHLDTVHPGCGIEPIIEGEWIRSAGDTILGADDKAGVTLILAGLRQIIEQHVPHGELQVVFTIAEEIGLYGATHLDYSLVAPRYALVFDGGHEIGQIGVGAPSANKMTWKVHGVAAHAGVHPEQGTNAIRIAAEAIAEMKIGRLDEETTANIGIINGGLARNIVPELCEVKGEARSHDESKLSHQLEHMRACFRKAVERYPAARLEEEVSASYTRFRLTEEDEVVHLAAQAARNLNMQPGLHIGGGGSDANIFNEKGIPAAICACGGQHPHCLNEQLNIPALAKGVEWLVECVRISGEVAGEYPEMISLWMA